MSLAPKPVRVGSHAFLAVMVTFLPCVAGCGPGLPSAEELAAFEAAGPLQPVVDVERLIKSRRPVGPYRVIAGDVLELQIPAAIRSVAKEARTKVEAYLCRIDDKGEIALPLIGRMKAAGKTLAEIEAEVVAAYYPKYMAKPPPVVARVAEYRTVAVSIVGAVNEPGLYRLRGDEMSLVALLMKAGGIVKDGATVIRVRRRPGRSGKTEELALPVKGLSIPFADVALAGGESVEVERLAPQVFTVTGPVNKPGAFPYPPGARYTLMEALGFAGGRDDTADPQYVRIYRQNGNGQVIAAAFKIAGRGATEPSTIRIKPGDVVAVAHTARTRARRALSQVFHVGTGLYAGATYNLNPSQ